MDKVCVFRIISKYIFEWSLSERSCDIGTYTFVRAHLRLLIRETIMTFSPSAPLLGSLYVVISINNAEWILFYYYSKVLKWSMLYVTPTMIIDNTYLSSCNIISRFSGWLLLKTLARKARSSVMMTWGYITNMPWAPTYQPSPGWFDCSFFWHPYHHK